MQDLVPHKKYQQGAELAEVQVWSSPRGWGGAQGVRERPPVPKPCCWGSCPSTGGSEHPGNGTETLQSSAGTWLQSPQVPCASHGVPLQWLEKSRGC